MGHVLAYDFGTGGIKASLMDERGKCLADGFDAYDTLYPEHGFHEQRPADWWRATVTSTRKLLAGLPGDTPARIEGIGISGHSLGLVPIDSAGQLLRETVPIWSDSRTDTQPERFFEKVAEEDWYRLTGNGFPPALYTIFKIMWLREREPELFERIHKILGTKDYINYRLTGEIATDHSYASGSGVYDLVRRVYSDVLIEASGIDAAILPEIVPSTRVLGTLTAASADELGLPRSVKVVAGGVDNACMSLGAGAFRPGRAYNSLGSSSWIAVSSAEPLLDATKRPYVFDHVVPGQYVSALAIFSAGTSLAWVRDNLCRDLASQAEAEGDSIYSLMDREAATSPVGANGVFFNPSMAGGNALDATPRIRGAFMNLDLRNTRADLLRATMEGIAFGLRHVLDELSRLSRVVAPLALVGGGANSALWRQIYADVYGIPVARLASGQQAAALGAAAVAAVGTGLWSDFAEMDHVVGTDELDEPNPESAAVYAQLMDRHRAASQLLGNWAQ